MASQCGCLLHSNCVAHNKEAPSVKSQTQTASVDIGVLSRLINYSIALLFFRLLKDGVGRIARMTLATNFGQSFDSDLKVSGI
jgi:hypothetical protein